MTHCSTTRVLAAVVAGAVCGCGQGAPGESQGEPLGTESSAITTADDTAADAGGPTLRSTGKAHHRLVGTALNYGSLTTDTTYTTIAGQEFDYATPENETKWGIAAADARCLGLHPGRRDIRLRRRSTPA